MNQPLRPVEIVEMLPKVVASTPTMSAEEVDPELGLPIVATHLLGPHLPVLFGPASQACTARRSTRPVRCPPGALTCRGAGVALMPPTQHMPRGDTPRSGGGNSLEGQDEGSFE
jgi:hypothetical protein